jgi:hypothetical protein
MQSSEHTVNAIYVIKVYSEDEIHPSFERHTAGPSDAISIAIHLSVNTHFFEEN